MLGPQVQDSMLHSFATESPSMIESDQADLNTDIMQSWLERKQRKIAKEFENKEQMSKIILKRSDHYLKSTQQDKGLFTLVNLLSRQYHQFWGVDFITRKRADWLRKSCVDECNHDMVQVRRAKIELADLHNQMTKLFKREHGKQI